MSDTTIKRKEGRKKGGSLEAQGGWRAPLVGANAENGSNASVSAFNENNEASSANVNIGASLTSASTNSQGQPRLSAEHDAHNLAASRTHVSTVAQHKVITL